MCNLALSLVLAATVLTHQPTVAANLPLAPQALLGRYGDTKRSSFPL